MSGTGGARPKAGAAEGIRIETLARWLRGSVLATSITTGREHGGVIWRGGKAGKPGDTGPFEGDAKAHADVRVLDGNRGCIAGTACDRRGSSRGRPPAPRAPE